MSEVMSVALIEDDPAVLMSTQQSLELAGFHVLPFSNGQQALKILHDNFPGVVLSDVKLPEIDGLQLLEALLARDHELPVVLITGHGDVSMAVRAMRLGAHDFIEKPFSVDRLIEVIHRAIDQRRLVIENRQLKSLLMKQRDGQLIGNSPGVRRIKDILHSVGSANVDVLITGETGTGKEIVARALHEVSGRHGEFVAVNCGAFPEAVFESEMFGHEAGAFTGASRKRTGKIEYAAKGTLFLDEIESMPYELQIKLLRVLQERKFERLGGNSSVEASCRFVASSKANLEQLVKEGKFRRDLFFRLNVVTLNLPPLRERKEDIPVLFAHFAHLSAIRFQKSLQHWSVELIEDLKQQPWEGNVRELRNFSERYVLGLHELSENESELAAQQALPSFSLEARITAFEKRVIEQTLSECKGQVSLTAEQLNLPRKTLYDKLKRYDIHPENFRKKL
ncbi:MAG: sigma-54-dependent Fis family transcriptional regulator [Burkholderiales bacterium]|jgi:two-component system C4-dicarboxylate transport response regulator DctD|nr:sigma-54-dependent Fis family transcriptional regulator [Burkholderiales bacterium]MCA3162535.1 sigma-54-dependent Fis family transcriptional regulator [Burkholderiales bacterium]MCA3163982.1 sigma-54-dependent Fis family transcriptional regulator [Burkholderiales bacterium]MCA3166444.1 sigma-54-dependent Fis family transcriptional regulator [Burkholderiales bacterium]MCA3170872.1 sigma-54-dependent Fis family transcriptional regulator [Burkholderiales bacterium]